MAPRRAVIALLLVQLVALAASAQSEFGRATGGEIAMTPKRSSSLSGSLDVSAGDVFGAGLSAGGTLIQDRLWFFGSVARQESTRFSDLQLPANATSNAIGAKVNSQITAGHDFTAMFSETTARRSPLIGIAPASNFLSLRYTGVLSSNMFFTASVTRRE